MKRPGLIRETLAAAFGAVALFVLLWAGLWAPVLFN